MKRPLKKYLPAVYTGAVLAILLTVCLLFLPHLIFLESVKTGIEARLSDVAGGKITYQEAALRLLPWPRLTVRQSTIDIPGKITGTIDSLVVVPKLVPLVTGNIEIRELKAIAPDLRIQLPSGAGESTTGRHSISGAGAVLAAGLSRFGQTVREDISIRMIRGRLELMEKTGPFLAIKDIQGSFHFRPDRVALRLQGQSIGGGKLAVDVELDPITRTGGGHLDLDHFSPKNYVERFFPQAPVKIEDSLIDLRVGFTTDGLATFSGGIASQWSILALARGKKNITLRDGRFNSTFTMGRGRSEVSVTHLDLGYPDLTLKARFLADPDASRYQWNITASDIQVPDTRDLLLFLAPGSKPLRNIFHIIRGGKVQRIELKDEADTPEGLRSAKGLQIQGILESGEIYIPKPDLYLTEASGWIGVANGVLEGKNLRARLGGSRGHGMFSMGLEKHRPPFFLDAMIEADLSQLPPLLHRLVPNPVFKQEMAKVSDARGKANGRLILEQTQKQFLVTVDVSQFNLTGRYKRIPYPIAIEKGRFQYGAERVTLKGLDGRIGQSVFSELDATIGTSSPFDLDINTGSLAAHMDEVHPWLISYKTVAAFLRHYDEITGNMTLEAASLKGPALYPAQWQFSLAGSVDNFQFTTPHFPAPIRLTTGRFRANPRTIVFDRTDVHTMETRLSAEGKLTGYLEEARHLEATLMGALDAGAAAWVMKMGDIPEGLAWRAPIFLTPADVRWIQNTEISVNGAARMPDGPLVELRLTGAPRLLAMEKLTIRDDDSDANISLRMEDKTVDVGFSGKLHEKTINALLKHTPFLTGQIEGDFIAGFTGDAPQLATANGHLFAEKIDFSAFSWPLSIAQANIVGTGNGLKLTHTRFAWQGEEFLIDGSVNGGEKWLNMDLTMAVEKMKWQKIADMLEDKAGGSQPVTLPLGNRLPLYGNIKVRAEKLVCGDAMTFCPFDVSVALGENRTDMVINQAALCGVSLTGSLTRASDQYQFKATPTATDQNLAATLGCLLGNQKTIDGKFQLSGQLKASGKPEMPLAEALTGDIAFRATQGRIHRFGLAAKIFSFLNVAGLLKGELPDLDKEGFPYKSVRAAGTINDGVLKITEGEIDGRAMRIFFQGKVNYLEKTHNMTIVVAPLNTIDLLVRHIPLVRDILDKGVVIYPIKVSGTWADPKLRLLAPDAVGEEIWGMVVRTLKLPLKILEPIFSGGKKKQSLPDKPSSPPEDLASPADPGIP